MSAGRRRLLKQDVFREADVRPTLLGIVTLLFLLLFFLLSTSTGQRLGVVGIKADTSAQIAALPHNGLLKELRVSLDGATLTLVGDVQTTDIAAAATSTEQRVVTIPPKDGHIDLAQLGAALQKFHQIDPSQDEIILLPGDTTTVEQLFGVMDAARTGGSGALFPKVSLGGGA